MNTFYQVFRGVSVSFVHSFERVAPFSFQIPPLFQKYIHFYLTDFWVLGLMIGAFSFKEVHFKTLFFNRHSRYLTLYTGVALLSIVFSLFSGYFFQYTTLINLTLGFLVFHLVYTLMEKEWLPSILWAFLAVATLESLIGTGQFLMQHSLGLSFLSEPQITPYMKNIATYPVSEGSLFARLPWIPEGHTSMLRAYGTFDHPNILGAYLAVSLFMTYFLFITSKKQKLLLAILPLQIFTLALTFSRGPIFAWGLGTSLFFGIGFFKKTLFAAEERKHFLQLGGWIGAIFLCIMALLFKELATRGGFVNTNALSAASDGGRLLFYKIALTLFLAYPLLGIGYNGFALFPYETISSELLGANPTGALAHNFFLQIASETGFLGLILVLLFIGSLYKPFFKARLTLPMLMLGTVLLTLLLTGFVDHFLWAYPSGRALFFISCALLATSTQNRSCIKQTRLIQSPPN